MHFDPMYLLNLRPELRGTSAHSMTIGATSLGMDLDGRFGSLLDSLCRNVLFLGRRPRIKRAKNPL